MEHYPDEIYGHNITIYVNLEALLILYFNGASMIKLFFLGLSFIDSGLFDFANVKGNQEMRQQPY